MATVEEDTTAKRGEWGIGVMATMGGDSSIGTRNVGDELTQAMVVLKNSDRSSVDRAQCGGGWADMGFGGELREMDRRSD